MSILAESALSPGIPRPRARSAACLPGDLGQELPGDHFPLPDLGAEAGNEDLADAGGGVRVPPNFDAVGHDGVGRLGEDENWEKTELFCALGVADEQFSVIGRRHPRSSRTERRPV